MRRMIMTFAAILAALVLGSGLAYAAAISGTNGQDTLTGTEKADNIYGLGGDDRIFGVLGADDLYGGGGVDKISGGKGADELYGGSGSDILRGQDGDDYINSADNGRQDVVNCGAGGDRAVVDEEDGMPTGCEIVTVDFT